MNLTARELACLEYLRDGSADNVSIGRAVLRAIDPDEWEWTGSVVAGSLETRGLVESRELVEDLDFWRITPKGRAELRKNRPSPNESSRVESDRYALSDANRRR